MVSNLSTLLEYEEGWRETPYPCSEGYPTVGFGFKLGPKLAKPSDIKLYNFRLPRAAGEVWLEFYVQEMINSMTRYPAISAAMRTIALMGVDPTDNARAAVLMSMAFQMGEDGLAKFVNTLGSMAAGDWEAAAKGMLASKWAQQTPNRAKRHAEQMRTGLWQPEYRK